MRTLGGAVVIVAVLIVFGFAAKVGMARVERGECAEWSAKQSDYAEHGYQYSKAGMEYPSANSWQLAQCNVYGVSLVGAVDMTKE